MIKKMRFTKIDMSDNFRKLNIHFDIDAIKNAYNIAINDIGFSGDLVNCISLTHTEATESDPRRAGAAFSSGKSKNIKT